MKMLSPERCAQVAACTLLFSTPTNLTRAEVLPLSDPHNRGGWVLNTEISDEFDGSKIDRAKWFVQGQNGGDYYIWKGRPPSQYAEHNVYQEDGMLKIRSQWELDFPFHEGTYADGGRNNQYGVWEDKPKPITTGAIISKKRFLNGYMEARTRAADANMTSAFWCIGYESEIDIYEQIGHPKIEGSIRENTWKATVHDWSPPAVRPTRRFGLNTNLPFRVADRFSVYGCEWGEDYLRLYLDGKLFYETTREKEGINWVLNNPLEIWFDCEIFVWLGLPHKEELPCYYDIDYVRIWQKPQKNLLQRQFFGFEGPILFEDQPRPLDLLPESSEFNDYQQFWLIGEHELNHFSIAKGPAAKGIKSLRFNTENLIADLSIETPARAVDIPAGTFGFSMQVFVEPDCNLEFISASLADPGVQLEPFDLRNVRKGTWVTLKQTFQRDRASGPHDRLRFRIDKEHGKNGNGSLYIDDISISIK